MENNMRAFVIGCTGKALMPTTPRKARIMLKNGDAEVYSKRPFTIKLLKKSGATTQQVKLGIDTGEQNIGVAVIANEKVLYKAEIELRKTMEKKALLVKRKELRRGRRYRNTPYRHPKFRFHTKRVYSEKLVARHKHKTHWVKIPNSIDTNRRKGWLPPSIQQKVDFHSDWIDRYLAVLPKGTELHIEIAKFDIQKMQNPEINGVMYQRGDMYDYENLKFYVFARDNYTCAVCKRKGGTHRQDGSTVKLHMHHINFRSKGGSDNPKNLITVCDKCHTNANHKPGGKLYNWMQENKTVIKKYSEPTFMNILRKRMSAKYPDAIFTYGNITSVDRKALGLCKSHANDAIAIANGPTSEIIDNNQVVYYKEVRKKKRSLHEANARKGKTKPNRHQVRNEKNTKSKNGINLWDEVRYCGNRAWISGFTGDNVYLVNRKGNYFKHIAKSGKEYKSIPPSKIKVIKHNNNWINEVGNSTRHLC